MIGWATALTMVLEMGIIATQAWRGTTSHFNVGRRSMRIAVRIMGVAIVTQTLSTIAVAVALWRIDSRTRRWAGRCGSA